MENVPIRWRHHAKQSTNRMLQSQGVLYVTTVDEDIKERESSQSIFASNICLHLVDTYRPD